MEEKKSFLKQKIDVKSPNKNIVPITRFEINIPKTFIPSFLNSLAHCFLVHKDIVLESNS